MKKFIYSILFVLIFTINITNGSDCTVDLKSGLVAYYPFNGNANDASGNGNNGTVNGATLTTDRFGNANEAYYFNGSADIRLPDNCLNGNFNTTINVWVTDQNTGGLNILIGSGDIRPCLDPITLQFNGHKPYNFGFEDVVNRKEAKVNYGIIPIIDVNKWTMLTIVLETIGDNSSLRLYFNSNKVYEGIQTFCGNSSAGKVGITYDVTMPATICGFYGKVQNWIGKIG